MNNQLDVNAIFSNLVAMMIVIMMMQFATKALEPPLAERLGLPRGYEPVRRAKPTRAELLEQFRRERVPTAEEALGVKKERLEAEGERMAEQAGVKFVELDEGWQATYGMVRYWFEDARGNRIIATDPDELRWKLSI